MDGLGGQSYQPADGKKMAYAVLRPIKPNKREGTGWKPAPASFGIKPLAARASAGVLFLINGRHIPQGLDDARHDLEDFVDVCLGVIHAQGKD